MKTITAFIETIIIDVLTALYQNAGASIVFAFMSMFFFIVVEKCGGVRSALKMAWDRLRNSRQERYIFSFAFYTAMILFRTLLCRPIWSAPLAHVIGVWGIYDENGNLTTEVIENLILFIPFAFLVLNAFPSKFKIEAKCGTKVIRDAGGVSFLFSVIIELLQVFLKVGTFQLSDLFYNTLGGLIGGLIYWCGYKLIRRNKKEQ